MRNVELLAAFGFNDPNIAAGVTGDKIWGVGGEVAIGFDVINAKSHSEVILGKRLDIRGLFKETGKVELEPSTMNLANNAIEDGFFRGHK